MTWTNPQTGTTHTLESQVLTRLPCPGRFRPGMPVTVFVDPDDPLGNYHVEIEPCAPAVP